MTLQSPRMLPDVGKIPQLVNKSIFMPQLRKKLAKDGVKRPLIMIHHVPISAAIALQNELQPDVSIYRCVYDWSNDPHSGRVLQEKELLQIVDEVWADCEANVNRTSKYHNNVQLMPPGVDLDLFADIEKSKPVEKRTAVMRLFRFHWPQCRCGTAAPNQFSISPTPGRACQTKINRLFQKIQKS
ncbi:MAG: hypothetical protein M5U34_33325 [Chloroflexi bacterium]|nr:hypothetical protein [Chloroflexota bacterium]